MSDLTPQQIVYFFQQDAATQSNPCRADVYSQTWKLIEQQQARISGLEQLLRDSAKAADQFYQQRNHAIEKRDELAATVERLRDACQLAFQTPLDEYYSKNVNSILYQAINSTLNQNLNAVKREVYVAGYMDGYNRSLQPTSTMFSQNDHKERATQYANQRYPDKERKKNVTEESRRVGV